MVFRIPLQARQGTKKRLARKGENAPKYIIERDIPGAGKLTKQELTGVSQKSCAVLSELGPKV